MHFGDKKMDKAFIRGKMKRELANQTANDIEKKSREISRRLAGLEEFKNAKEIFTYISTDSEVQTREIIDSAIGMGKSIYCPAVRDRKIVAGAFGGELVQGSFGIMEPKQASDRKDFDLIIVPGIAFDPGGARIGRGGGHFDRFLAEAKGEKIALAFEFQIIDRINCEPHDMRVNAIVTEKRTIRTKSFTTKWKK